MERSLKFVNLLPLKIRIVCRRQLTPQNTELVGVLKGNTDTLTTDKTQAGNPFSVGDEIHILYSPLQGKNDSNGVGLAEVRGRAYEILEPITLVAESHTIRIGDVSYDEKTNTLVQRSHSDISGLRFHNKTTIPVNIYFAGVRLATCEAGNGTGLHSGSPGTVYVNKDTKGFNIGDQLDLRLMFRGPPGKSGSPTMIEKPWCTFYISDNFMSDVYLGTVSQLSGSERSRRPPSDVYSYRAGSANYSGLKYIQNTTPGSLAYSSYY